MAFPKKRKPLVFTQEELEKLQKQIDELKKKSP